MLEDYYRDLNITRSTRGKSTDPIVTTEFIIKGFIQPVSGTSVFREGKGGEQATHRIYASTDTGLIYGDKVTENDQTYIVIYAVQPNGISGVGHHKEYIAGIVE